MTSLLPLLLILGFAAIVYTSIVQYPVKLGGKVKLHGSTWSRRRASAKSSVELFKAGKWVDRKGKEVKSTGSKTRVIYTLFIIDNFQKADSGYYYPNHKGEPGTIPRGNGTSVLGPVWHIYVK